MLSALNSHESKNHLICLQSLPSLENKNKLPLQVSAKRSSIIVPEVFPLSKPLHKLKLARSSIPAESDAPEGPYVVYPEYSSFLGKVLYCT